MQVIIKQLYGVWILSVENSEQVIWFYTDRRLISVIDMANTLQLHITNISELPLNQYKECA